MVDQALLDAQISYQKIIDETSGYAAVFLEQSHHRLSLDDTDGAMHQCYCRGQVCALPTQATFSEKIPFAQDPEHCAPAVVGNQRQFDDPLFNVVHVRALFALRNNGLARFVFDDLPCWERVREKRTSLHEAPSA